MKQKNHLKKKMKQAFLIKQHIKKKQQQLNTFIINKQPILPMIKLKRQEPKKLLPQMKR